MKTTIKMQLAIEAIINYVYFTFNYTDIKGILKSVYEENLANHLIDKFYATATKYGNDDLIGEFLGNLTYPNQKKFLQYVIANYHHSDHYKKIQKENAQELTKVEYVNEIINYLYFTYNYSLDDINAIVEQVGEKDSLSKHIKEKWRINSYKRAGVNHFLAYLTPDRREIMLKYIMKNYNSGCCVLSFYEGLDSTKYEDGGNIADIDTIINEEVNFSKIGTAYLYRNEIISLCKKSVNNDEALTEDKCNKIIDEVMGEYWGYKDSRKKRGKADKIYRAELSKILSEVTSISSNETVTTDEIPAQADLFSFEKFAAGGSVNKEARPIPLETIKSVVKGKMFEYKFPTRPYYLNIYDYEDGGVKVPNIYLVDEYYNDVWTAKTKEQEEEVLKAIKEGGISKYFVNNNIIKDTFFKIYYDLTEDARHYEKYINAADVFRTVRKVLPILRGLQKGSLVIDEDGGTKEWRGWKLNVTPLIPARNNANGYEISVYSTNHLATLLIDNGILEIKNFNNTFEKGGSIYTSDEFMSRYSGIDFSKIDTPEIKQYFDELKEKTANFENHIKLLAINFNHLYSIVKTYYPQAVKNEVEKEKDKKEKQPSVAKDDDILQIRIDALKLTLEYEDDPKEKEELQSMIEALELTKEYAA